MHVRELLELAALLTSHHGELLTHDEQQLSTGLDQYWIASKQRLDIWFRELRTFRDSQDAPPESRRAAWRVIRGVLEEILASEVLTRVWTGCVILHEREIHSRVASGIVRSILLGHGEARLRTLKILLDEMSTHQDETLYLNRLRRRAESWTDLLIGHLPQDAEIHELAFNPQRAQDFAQDLQEQPALRQGSFTWQLLMAALQNSFPTSLRSSTPHAELNKQIAAGILATFEPGVFNATGVMHGRLVRRVSQITEETQVMLDELWSLENAAEPPADMHAAFRNKMRRVF